MTNPEELKMCGCGHIPKKLHISDAGQGQKWANASGDCCDEWSIEFRTGYNGLETDACMTLAIEAWNDATRTQADQAATIAQLQAEIAVLVKQANDDADELLKMQSQIKQIKQLNQAIKDHSFK